MTVLVAFVGLVGGLMAWFGKGIAFVLKRWWTGSPRQDQASYLNTVADLGAKLRAHGMTIEDVHALETVIHNPSIKSSEAATRVVEQTASYEPRAFRSNMAMKARTGAAHQVAQAELHQALMDLQLLVGDEEWECIQAAQEIWQQYCDALRACAFKEYKGGTHAGLAASLVALAETERRTAEIRATVRDRAR